MSDTTLIPDATAPAVVASSDPDADAAATEAVAERLFGAVLGAGEVQATFLGDRLGWYRALADGPRTPTELAAATDTDARYAREWLEHQTVAGYVTVEDASVPADQRRYELPAAHVPVLADPDSLSYMAPFARLVAGLGTHLDRLVEVYRTGDGFSWAEMGEHALHGQAEANRPMFLHQLGHEYLASVPDVAAALGAGGRVADIGCGFGWSSIGVALAFPKATVVGFDVDSTSIDAARRNAADRGVADRVTFELVDAGAPTRDEHRGAFDLVMALECIHDLPHPVDVLATMRSMVADSGTTIVMDERVAADFTGEPDPIEQFMYGFSLMCCLPDGRSHEHSAATGTVMRPPTLQAYAAAAGYDGVEALDIDNDFFRFYRLEATRR